jgi:hypothetical protein
MTLATRLSRNSHAPTPLPAAGNDGLAAPPHNRDAEEAVIGSIFKNGLSVADALPRAGGPVLFGGTGERDVTRTGRPTQQVVVTALLYRRVSTEEQTRFGGSLATQRTATRRYAAGQGWTIGGEFEDVLSGLRCDRPGYQAMLAEVARVRASSAPAAPRCWTLVPWCARLQAQSDGTPAPRSSSRPHCLEWPGVASQHGFDPGHQSAAPPGRRWQ